MRNFILSLLLILATNIIHGQGITYTILSSEEQSITIQVDFPQIDKEEISMDGEIHYRLYLDGAYHSLEKGAPEVLITAQSIMIPEDAAPTIELVDERYTETSDVKLAPSRGKLYRNVDPSTVPFAKGEIYNIDGFYPDKPCTLNEPYQLRDLHGVSIVFSPAAYNPVKNMLKEYQRIVVKINYNGKKSIHKPKKSNKEFAPIYKRQFLNYEEAKYDVIQEEGMMLIIAPEAFIQAVQPLADWKIKRGLPTEIVAMETIGSTQNELLSYLTNYYAEHNLTYVLLVGDYQQVPSYRARVDYDMESIDNRYTEVTGSDYYPDYFLGRFSAESVEDVEIQVQKSIMYESAPEEVSHFPVYVGIASREGPGDNGELDYQHIRKIGNKLANYTYTSGYEFFEGSQGGLDASGNPQANSVVAAINDGVGIINYCGHGDWNMFYTSGFMNGHVQALQNYNKLPFIIATACLNGQFVGQTCFAEHWLRAKKEGKPTGAVATLMSSIIQAWDPPMAGQDEITNIITESIQGQTTRSFGGIAFSGLCEILDTYYDYETTRTWLIFGDPSLQIRTAEPKTIVVNHPDIVSSSETSIAFTTEIEDVVLTISADKNILHSAVMPALSTTIDLDNLNRYDTLYVVGTKSNHIPYVGIIKITDGDIPEPPIDTTIIEKESGILYPNPATNFVYISKKDFPTEEPVSCLIFNMEGKQTIHVSASKTDNRIDISQLTSGSYVLRMIVDGKVVKRYKLVVI